METPKLEPLNQEEEKRQEGLSLLAQLESQATVPPNVSGQRENINNTTFKRITISKFLKFQI